jgi:hypothetical protein
MSPKSRHAWNDFPQESVRGTGGLCLWGMAVLPSWQSAERKQAPLDCETFDFSASRGLALGIRAT